MYFNINIYFKINIFVFQNKNKYFFNYKIYILNKYFFNDNLFFSFMTPKIKIIGVKEIVSRMIFSGFFCYPTAVLVTKH